MQQRIIVPYNARSEVSTSWTQAYKRFLRSRDESLTLKIAPLALLGLLPLDIISNIVPLVGELDDIGFLIALVIVAGRTYNRVRKYR
jgi:uncharacterized membrane protein YkvA (DUF1232 family)